MHLHMCAIYHILNYFKHKTLNTAMRCHFSTQFGKGQKVLRPTYYVDRAWENRHSHIPMTRMCKLAISIKSTNVH